MRNAPLFSLSPKLVGMGGATVLLHLAGIAVGWALRRGNVWLPRAAGAAVVALGAALLVQAA